MKKRQNMVDYNFKKRYYIPNNPIENTKIGNSS